MEYYRSSYYADDYGEYPDDHGEYDGDFPYNNFDSASVQDSTSYYSYNSNNYQTFASDSVPFFADYDNPVSSYSRIGYSVSTYSEPKYIEYAPPPHYSAQTQFIISYYVSQLDDTEFDEYDPTPYGGGYDLTLTYGKPLPPSDEICYPRSAPHPSASPSDAASSGVIATPDVREIIDEPAAKPQAEGKPPTMEEAEKQIQEPKDKNGDGGLGSRGEDGYKEHEKQVVAQIPSGYGLEAMDLCEGIFGYWPCLSRYGKRWADCQEIAADCGNHNNQWKSTADYLFGSPYPYGEPRDVDHGYSYGNVIHGYENERHYHQQQQQPLYHQVDDFWFL